MSLSQKCQYALRAAFELARQEGKGPVRIADIAEAQAIPVRFLEVILTQLRQGGFVESRRGAEGGYLLARPAFTITMGSIIRFVDGPLSFVRCVQGLDDSECTLKGHCAFQEVWNRAEEVVSQVFDGVTLSDLVAHDRLVAQVRAMDYSI